MFDQWAYDGKLSYKSLTRVSHKHSPSVAKQFDWHLIQCLFVANCIIQYIQFLACYGMKKQGQASVDTPVAIETMKNTCSISVYLIIRLPKYLSTRDTVKLYFTSSSGFSILRVTKSSQPGASKRIENGTTPVQGHPPKVYVSIVKLFLTAFNVGLTVLCD